MHLLFSVQGKCSNHKLVIVHTGEFEAYCTLIFKQAELKRMTLSNMDKTASEIYSKHVVYSHHVHVVCNRRRETMLKSGVIRKKKSMTPMNTVLSRVG